jgi:hypothetical protein
LDEFAVKRQQLAFQLMQRVFKPLVTPKIG